MRLLIAVLSNRDHKPSFTISIANLNAYLAVRGREFGLIQHLLMIKENVPFLAQGRQDMMDYALQNGFTHILCIDDDSKFSHTAAETLICRNVQAIGANFVHKDITERRFTAIDFNYTRIDSRGKSGIQEVLQIGFGMFLLDLSVLSKLERPYFQTIWNPETEAITAEDVYFCRKLKSVGIKIYVDHDVSQNVGHIGNMNYNLNSYPQ